MFEELLNQKLSDIKEPDPLPPGTWKFVAIDASVDTVERDGEVSPVVLITASPIEPVKGTVDKRALAEFGDWSNEKVFIRFNLKKLPHLFRDFAKAIGYSDDLSIAEAVEKIKNAEGERVFLGEVTHNASNDGRIFVNVRKITAA